MKKFVSLILAALLILSCVAFADDAPNPAIGTPAVNFLDGGKGSASQHTDAWLQVTADGGTIDCTVPLVLVFKTNIDGGTATTGDSYAITNNSTAALKVTSVAITDMQAAVGTNGNNSALTLVETFEATDVDKYTLTVLPTDKGTTEATKGTWGTTAKNVAGTFEPSGKTYTFASSPDAEAPGLWMIDKANSGKNVSKVALTMATSKLSFITRNLASEGEGATKDKQKGVMVFNVTYTVKINDALAIGKDIAGTTKGTYGTDREEQNWKYDYLTASKAD